MRLIETIARWIDPETFRLLPTCYTTNVRITLPISFGIGRAPTYD